MADLADRHYGLFANNQHPIQLDTYEQYNEFLQSMHDLDLAKKNEAFRQDMDARVSKAEESLDSANGEKLSIEDKEEIYFDAWADRRARENMARNAKGRDGEINDYLELRRPFGSAQ